MSDHSQLARTGLGGGAVVIGGTAFVGWQLLLLVAAALVLIGAGIRLGFRRGRAAGDR